jgi:putative flippase GtrA
MPRSWWEQMTATGDYQRGALARTMSVVRADDLLGQGARYAICGATVSAIYIAITTVLSQASHLRFQLALVIGWCAAVSVHFTLQRTFVWSREEEFALPFGHQVGRYLVVAVSQLGLSATTTALLPGVLGVSAEVVYLATAAVVTLCNFLVFRFGVFHAEGSPSS